MNLTAFFKLTAANFGQINGIGTLNPVNLSTTGVSSTFIKGFSAILGLLTILGALYFLIQIVIAAYTILGSRGQVSKLDEGRERITFAVIGLAVVVAAYAITGLITNLFGINVFSPFTNPGVFNS